MAPFFATHLDGLLALCTLLYFLMACWFVTGARHRTGQNVHQPFVSVVIAARNEADCIAACLHNLIAQDYPPSQYEVLVVDDGSTDGTARIAREFAGGSVVVRLLQTHGPCSKKAALSMGIAEARGDIILSTDADCKVQSGWIRTITTYFEDGVGMVIGFSQIGSKADIQTWRQGYEAVDFLNLMACIWGSVGRGHPMAASGQNLAFRKEAFTEVGGYEKVMHRASGDDVLLLQMVRKMGRWNIAFATDRESFVQHPLAPSWSRLFGQRSRWASNAPTLMRLDPLFFAYMLLTFVLSGLILVLPWLVWSGLLTPVVAALALGLKVLGEWCTFSRGIELSGRGELHRYFPFWALVQPLHVVSVGILGYLGIFRWKGRSHVWGRRFGGQGAIELSGASRR